MSEDDLSVKLEKVRSEALGEIKDLRTEVLSEMSAHTEIIKSIKTEMRTSNDRIFKTLDEIKEQINAQTDYQIKLEKNIIENNLKIKAHDDCIQSVKSNSRWAFRTAIGSFVTVLLKITKLI